MPRKTLIILHNHGVQGSLNGVNGSLNGVNGSLNGVSNLMYDTPCGEMPSCMTSALPMLV
eukprot:10627006-Heterocapsa_arctica.AAC.1